MSDAGSIAGSTGSSVASGKGKLEPGGDDSADADAFEGGLETGVFGCLYTVSKEKHPSLIFVCFRLLSDLIQLLLLVMNPLYGYTINARNMAWQVFSFLQLNAFMEARGYTFFLVCLYVMIAGLALNVALCFWVSKSFANNSFGHVWPIVWLRIYSLIFYQVLDVASLTLLQMTFDCNYMTDGDMQYMHQEFDISCFEFPHTVHMAVAAVALVLFVVLATAFTTAEIDMNPASRNLLGMSHSKLEGTAFLLKVLMTSSTVFLTDVRWLSIVLFVTSMYMVWMYFYWEPYMFPYVNHVRVASYSMVFYASITLIALAFPRSSVKSDPDLLQQYQNQVTIALWAGLAPVAGLGWLASWLRLRYFSVIVVQKFKDAPADMKPKYIHKFEDPREVEIASRVLRVWLDEDTLDPDAMALAERILKAGKTELPNSPYMTILWSSFLIDVQESYISGYGQVQAAKKMSNLSVIERFAVFIRDQEHAQKATAATAGDSENVDLVSYVEFQRNYSVVLRLTKEAMLTRRGFWQALESHRMARFNKLAATVSRIDRSVRAAERMFRQVLNRHSNSVKILQLYVKFLQGVKNDPWTAAKWAAEAEKLQKAEEEANTKAIMGNKSGDADANSNKGVIIIGANCLIRMVNDTAVQAFGYEHKSALIGHNVNMIIPPPFNKNHNSYVRSYITTGQKRMIGIENSFVAMHKDKYVLPIKVVVTHLSGIGEDSVFMGVIQMIPEAPNVASIWLLSTGKILSCNATFTDWFGFKQADVNGQSLGDLVIERDEVEKLISQVKQGAVTQTHDAQANRRAPKRRSTVNNGKPNLMNGPGSGYLSGNATVGTPLAESSEEDPSKSAVHTEEDTAAKTDLIPVASNALILGKDVDSTLALMDSQPVSQASRHVSRQASRASSDPPARAVKVSYNGIMTKDKPEANLGRISEAHSEAPSRPLGVLTARPSAQQSFTAKKSSNGLQWALQDVRMRHFMSDEALMVNLEVQYGAIGDHIIYQVNMTRADDAGALMLVTDSKGRVRHVTQALATRLGTTVSRLHNSAAIHAMDALLPSPFVKLHHNLAWNAGSTQTLPWSCRSGLPMCVPAVTPKGMPIPQVYTMSFEQRVTYPPGTVFVPGQALRNAAELQHVITLSPSSLEAAFDARRLHLVVSSAGKVVKVSPSPDALFGFDVQSLVGNTIAHVVDVLRSKPGGTAGSVDSESQTSKVLMALADRNRANPGLSWRVGVSGVVDPADIAALGIVGEDIVTQLTKPAVMTVKYLTAAPRMQGSKVIMPSEIQYEVDLWRADYMVGVVEVDMSGYIVSTGVPDQPFYEPHTLFGCPPGRMLGTPLSNWLPIRDGMKPSIALFTEGALSLSGPVAGAAKKGGGMKSRAVKSSVGPTHTPRISHHADASDLDLRVTAASKGSAGASNTYVIVRFSETPATGRLDFMPWLLKGLDPMLSCPRPPPPGEKPLLTARTRTGEAPAGPAQRARTQDLSPTRVRTQDLDGSDADVSAHGGRRGVQFPGPINGLASLEGAGSNMVSVPSAPDLKEIEGSLASMRRSQEWLAQHLITSESPVPHDDGDYEEPVSVPTGPGRRGSVDYQTTMNGSMYGGHQESREEDELSEDQESVARFNTKQTVQSNEDDDNWDRLEEVDHTSDAGGMADYKRGKRYRKLSKILQGKEMTGSISDVLWVSYFLMILLMAMELAAYFSFTILLKDQDARVDFLYANVRVANEADRVLMHTQALEVLLSGKAVPGLRFLSNGTIGSSDITRAITRMNVSINEVERLHRGLFHGFDGDVSRMPEDYGIRDFWEVPSINITVFSPDKLCDSCYPLGTLDTVSLWTLGNLFTMAARNVRDRGVQMHVQGPTRYSNLTDVNFIKTNAIVTLNAAYRKAAAGLLTITLDRNQQLLETQKIGLILQTVLIMGVAFISLIIVSEALSLKRHRVYRVFTRVPIGVIHGLASAPLNIEDDKEDGDEDEEATQYNQTQAQQEQKEQDQERNIMDGYSAASKKDAAMRVPAGGNTLSMTAGNRGQPGPQVQTWSKPGPNRTGWKSVLSCCLPRSADPLGRPLSATGGPRKETFLTNLLSTFSANVDALPAKKGKGGIYGNGRGLVRSYVATLWLIWPLVAWAVVTLAVNVITRDHLKGLEGAISNLNVGGGVFQAAGRCNNWAIMMCAGYPNATLQNYIAAQLGPALNYFEVMYENELYGQNGDPSMVTFDVTGPNPSQGITFEGDGFYLLWNRTFLPNACLAYNPADCLNASSIFYPFTSNGLDAMMQKYMTSVQEILDLWKVGNATLASLPFKYLWEVGTVEMLDARRRMSLMYVAYVHSLYGEALDVHSISFIFSFIIVAVFFIVVLHPFISRVRAEPKRLAELLSSLPPEIEVESMVRQAIMRKREAEECENKSANMSMASLNNSNRGW